MILFSDRGGGTCLTMTVGGRPSRGQTRTAGGRAGLCGDRAGGRFTERPQQAVAASSYFHQRARRSRRHGIEGLEKIWLVSTGSSGRGGYLEV